MSTGGRWAQNSREGALLALLYQRIADMCGAGRDTAFARTSETAAGVDASGSGGGDGADQGDRADRDADAAVTTLYRAHYRSLVRLAALLLTDDIAAADEIVQDSFVALHAAWPGLRGGDQGPAYLRRAVVGRCRALSRRRLIAARNASRLPDGKSGADQRATARLECPAAVVAALRALPAREREAVVLRYYSNLSESQIAAVMGIREGAVRAHTARAMSSLRAVLEEYDDDRAPPDPRHPAPPDPRHPGAASDHPA